MIINFHYTFLPNAQVGKLLQVTKQLDVSSFWIVVSNNMQGQRPRKFCFSLVSFCSLWKIWNSYCTAVVDGGVEWSLQLNFFCLLPWSLFTFICSRSAIWNSYIFHIISLHGEGWTQQIDVAPNVWLHTLDRTDIAKVTGSNPVGALLFFRLLPFSCSIENVLQWSLFTYFSSLLGYAS